MDVMVDLEVRKEILNKIAARELGRLEGIHQSDLNYCLNKQALRKQNPVQPTEKEVLLYSIGYATQRWLTGQDADEEPIIKDGIIVTLDSRLRGVPFELKCTYMSDTKPIMEMTQWIRQIMAQCYVTGTNHAYLSVFCLMGNWKWVYKPKKQEKLDELLQLYGPNWEDHPTLKVYHLQFTTTDLDTNWKWFQNRRALFQNMIAPDGGALIAPKVAIPDVKDDWECESCNYKGSRCPRLSEAVKE